MTFYNEKGLKRFINAIFFSIAGFKATWKHEEAFRQEVGASISDYFSWSSPMGEVSMYGPCDCLGLLVWERYYLGVCR